MLAAMKKLALLFALALGAAPLPALAAPAEDAAAGDSYGDEWFDEEAEMRADEAAPLPPGAAAAPSSDAAPPRVDGADADPRALDDFRPALDPYGYWVDHPKYGRVWVPNRAVVGDYFAPYVTSGHWALDVDGNWVWVSDYPFGSVVFHYGRWVWVGGVGWSWVPGYRYAPAWVAWRVPTAGYAYVGWAPLPPSYVWFYGSPVAVWYYTPYPFVFVSSTFVFHHHVHRHIVRSRHRIRHVAGVTRRYRPALARPSTSGPSLDAARVPPSHRPVQRVAAMPRASGADQRALTYRRTSPAGATLRRSDGGELRRTTAPRSSPRTASDGRSLRIDPSGRSADSPRRSPAADGRRAAPSPGVRLERSESAPPVTRERSAAPAPPRRAAPSAERRLRSFDGRSSNGNGTLRRSGPAPSMRRSGSSPRR